MVKLASLVASAGTVVDSDSVLSALVCQRAVVLLLQSRQLHSLPFIFLRMQPLIYKKVKAHKNAHTVYNEKLLAEDTIHQVRVCMCVDLECECVYL